MLPNDDSMNLSAQDKLALNFSKGDGPKKLKNTKHDDSEDEDGPKVIMKDGIVEPNEKTPRTRDEGKILNDFIQKLQ